MGKKQNPASVIKVLGVDLAKSSVVLHGVDARGKAVLRRKMTHAAFYSWSSGLPRCLVGLEACGGAHFVARRLIAQGHDVRLMAPQFVKPYVKSHKNDARDAEAICEAVQRPGMHFVAVKTVAQQDVQALHRVRTQLVAERTAQSNQIRGLLLERGIVMAKGLAVLRKALPELVEDAAGQLTEAFKSLLRLQGEHLCQLDSWIADLEKRLRRLAEDQADSRRLATVPGIGLLTSTALPAVVGDSRAFGSGREFAAWLGLVPHQHSTGGKVRLLGISKRGDNYVRGLLIHGARAVLRTAGTRTDALARWVVAVAARRGKHKAIVALANKLARIAWALLRRETEYQPVRVS